MNFQECAPFCSCMMMSRKAKQWNDHSDRLVLLIHCHFYGSSGANLKKKGRKSISNNEYWSTCDSLWSISFWISFKYLKPELLLSCQTDQPAQTRKPSSTSSPALNFRGLWQVFAHAMKGTVADSHNVLRKASSCDCLYMCVSNGAHRKSSVCVCVCVFVCVCVCVCVC